MSEKHTQSPEKDNVWPGIVGDHINGPFFLDANLTGDTYSALLRNNVIHRSIYQTKI